MMALEEKFKVITVQHEYLNQIAWQYIKCLRNKCQSHGGAGGKVGFILWGIARLAFASSFSMKIESSLYAELILSQLQLHI